MDHDERGKRAFARRRVENALNGFIAALVGDGLAVGGEASEAANKNGQREQTMILFM